MSTELATAEKTALEVFNFLQPLCDRIKIAGSIRRRVPLVETIEIVADPTNINKFAEAVYTNFHAPFPKGARYIKFWRDGIQIDLFIPLKNDFIRTLVVKTGSVDFVKYNIAKGWVNQGWRSTSEGLRLEKECEEKTKGRRWICVTGNPTVLPDFASEQEFFSWLDINYVQPKNRV